MQFKKCEILSHIVFLCNHIIAVLIGTPTSNTGTNTFSSDRRRFASVKRSAFGTARKLTLAGRSQSLRIKRNTEPLRPHTSNGRSGSGTIATVPLYMPTSQKTSRSASNSTPLFNTSLLELKEPVELDIPCDPDDVTSSLEFRKRKSSQDNPGYDPRGMLSNYLFSNR